MGGSSGPVVAGEPAAVGESMVLGESMLLGESAVGGDPVVVGGSVVVGRQAELRLAGEALRTGGAVLLSGAGGSGLSTLADALAAESAAQGTTVLRCRPAAGEAELRYAGLTDLLAGLPGGYLDELLARLPLPGRVALSRALLRTGGPGCAVDRAALGRGLVELLGAVGAGRGLLLVLDGVQWLDEPSAAALGFALRRVTGAAGGVRLLATARDAVREPVTRWWELCPPGTAEIRLPPLPATAIADLLARELGGPLPAALLRDVRRVAGGNPGHALALARAGFRCGLAGPEGVPGELRAEVLAEIRPWGPATRRLLVRAAVVARPTVALLRAATGSDPLPLLDGPLDAGLLTLVDAARPGRVLPAAAEPRAGELRFVAPLVRAVLLAEATPAELAGYRAESAAVTADPVERAELAALALQPPVDALPPALAARLARGRDEPEAAYRLALLALRQGAVREDPAAAEPLGYPTRLVEAADHAAAAERRPEARALALQVLAVTAPTSPAGAVLRARARGVLVRVLGPAAAGVGAVLADGLAELGELRDGRGEGRGEGRGVLPAAAEAVVAEPAAAEPAAAEPAAAEPAAAESVAAESAAAEAELLRWAACRQLLTASPRDAVDAARAARTAAAGPEAVARQLAVLALLGEAHAAAGEPRAARVALAQSRALLGKVRPPARRTELRLALLDAELALDDPGALRAALASVLDAHPGLEPCPDPGFPAVLAPSFVLTAMAAPDPVFPAGPHPAVLARVCAAQAQLGDAGCAMATAALLRETLAALGEPVSVPAADRGAQPHSNPSALQAIALAELVGGSAVRAGEVALRAAVGWAAVGDSRHRAQALGVLGESGLLRGEAVTVAAAVEALQEARRLTAALGHADPGAVRRLALLAEGLVALGEHAAAAQVLDEGQALLRPWEGFGAGWEVGAGRWDAEVGGRDAEVGLRAAEVGRSAQVDLDCAEPGGRWDVSGAGGDARAGRWDMPGPGCDASAGRWEATAGCSARAALERAAGLAQAGLGDGREAVDRLRAAADQLRAAGLPLELARTLVALGSVERRLRHRPGARAALLEARQLCADHAARPLHARVERELARLDQAVAVPGADGGLLTASEQRMAGLAADGATNREVAAALFVSVKTVEGTLSRVYRKLGVRSRAGLARALAAES
ncbi:AAA family ATPase [Kitasatospora sp. LaBMicrA B282]|uniref:AAA family ATPase n=1 Tax=Kitasatospora sp. LaBMicrA B282 TaxID=3420949 RepID=UPI003D112BD9